MFVSVADTGIGIPEADLERVFEPFTQLDGSLSRRYPGAGLGLFMARAIVTAHGGQLRLTSRPGTGTTARIILPRSRVVRKPRIADQPGAALIARPGGQTVPGIPSLCSSQH